ncbi:MAG: DUF2061 domain-containing protein [Lacunisphaera sp.]|nr:DUF2061 domain-containing protein [Lacunisphaera sp.]
MSASSTEATPARDPHWRSFAKAVSWRCVGTLDTFVVSFVVLTLTGATGGSKGLALHISGGIASVEVVTKVILYYLHERVWARFLFAPAPKRLPGPAARLPWPPL